MLYKDLLTEDELKALLTPEELEKLYNGQQTTAPVIRAEGGSVEEERLRLRVERLEAALAAVLARMTRLEAMVEKAEFAAMAGSARHSDDERHPAVTETGRSSAPEYRIRLADSEVTESPGDGGRQSDTATDEAPRLSRVERYGKNKASGRGRWFGD